MYVSTSLVARQLEYIGSKVRHSVLAIATHPRYSSLAVTQHITYTTKSGRVR